MDIKPIKKIAPNIDLFLWRPVYNQPPLCTLKELEDGTYSINDLHDFHEALDLIESLKNGNSG